MNGNHLFFFPSFFFSCFSSMIFIEWVSGLSKCLTTSTCMYPHTSPSCIPLTFLPLHSHVWCYPLLQSIPSDPCSPPNSFLIFSLFLPLISAINPFVVPHWAPSATIKEKKKKENCLFFYSACFHSLPRANRIQKKTLWSTKCIFWCHWIPSKHFNF